MNMTETPVDETALLAEIAAEVERRFARMEDPAHGWEHIERVYKLALYLAEQEGADRLIAGLAALLHDLGRAAPQNDHATHHADLSVQMATALMNSHAVAAGIQEAVLHAIEAHSFSRNIPPRTLEARVVRDADRLDGLGAMGIIRWAITGAVRRTPETRSYYRDDPFAERRTPDDKHYMLDHFYTKLLKLRDTMATATGRRLAGERTVYMERFLDELRHELNLIDKIP